MLEKKTRKFPDFCFCIFTKIVLFKILTAFLKKFVYEGFGSADMI